jgi:putative photosynthetic complex assembly protein 2
VSWSGHILPATVTVAVWFLATGLIAWIDNRDRTTFPRSLALAAIGGVAGLLGVAASMHSVSLTGVYVAFASAILVWGWLEIGFLTGAMAGPRRLPCLPGASGWQRFADAAGTLLHHEIALATTALLLISLTWNAPNQLAAMSFVLLYALRLSTKLNLFHGVPNAATDILPPHLAYLTSYYGRHRLGWPLLVSTVAALAMSGWLGTLAFAAPAGSADAASASLLFALAALGAVEHLFLALPVRDGALWGWALPRGGKTHSIGRG